MNTPTSVDFRLAELRSVKTKGRSGPSGDLAYADLTIRVGLGEDFEVAAPFLAFIQEAGHPISLSIGQVQTRFGDKTAPEKS